MPQSNRNKLPKDDDGYIILRNGEYISSEVFGHKFGKDLEYEVLINHANITPRWKAIFEDWKQKGILN